MVVRVRPTPTRFPTNSLYTQMDKHTLAFYIKCVPHGWHTLAFYIKCVPPVGRTVVAAAATVAVAVLIALRKHLRAYER